MALLEMEALFKNLHLSEKSSFSLESLEDDYVLDVAAQNRISSDGNSYIAATSSNYTIRLLSKSNLAGTSVIKGHESVITGICWGKSDPNLLFSSSNDKTIRCWDIRTKPVKEVKRFEGSDETNNLFTSLDVNAADKVICAGTEAQGDDVYLMFWDIRSTDLLGCYSESHQDDITQVCFHPDNADKMATGSTDGLVCVFDVSEECEDDALSYTLNSCSTVAKVGWCGEKNDRVYCTTHIDTVHVWDSIEGDPVFELTDLKDTLKDADSIEYIVDCFSSNSSDMFILAGKHNGDLKVVDLTKTDCPRVACSLAGGHKATVRCLHWDAQSEKLFTGAEDSFLCLWSAESATPSNGTTPSKTKLKAKRPVGRRKNPYR